MMSFFEVVRFIHVQVSVVLDLSLSWIFLRFVVVYFRFQVKKKQFFRNFVTIMLFGAVGTIISCTIISLGRLLRFTIG